MKRIIILLLLFIASSALAQVPTRLTVLSPVHYEVFQRNTTGYGALRIAGEVEPTGGPYAIEWRLGAGGWMLLESGVTRIFDSTVQVPQGQYDVTVRVQGIEWTANWVGVGDVFVIAGQSNAVGQALNYQTYTHPTLKASLYTNSYQWTELRDPTDSPSGSLDVVNYDGSFRGSVWPLVATYIMADQNVPVAFIPAARGNTSIMQWQPLADPFNRNSLFGALSNRVGMVGGVRAMLWHQGETDARNNMSPAAYAHYLEQIAAAFNAQTGAPLMATLLQDMRYATPTQALRINTGIEQAIAETPYILLGADLTDIPSDDSAHLTSNAHLQQWAAAWWIALEAGLYR